METSFVTVMSFFAFHPLRVAGVLSLMLLPCFFTWHKKSARKWMAATASPWAWFAYTEATTSTTSNIRVDLTLLGPVYLFVAAVWLVVFIAGRSPRES